jgi:cytochrome c5
MTHHDHGSSTGLAPEDASMFKTFTLVLVGLAVIGIVAFALAQIIGHKDTSNSPERIAAAQRRTQPFGKVSLEGEAAVSLAKAEAPAARAAKVLEGGEAIYGAVCAACHSMGVAGAPKTGDAAAWEPRVAQGWATLAEHAINGYQGSAGLMPARGGRADLSDEGVQQAIGFMLAEAKLGDIVPAEFLPGAAAPAASDAAEAPAEAPAAEEVTEATDATTAEAPAEAAAETPAVAETTAEPAAAAPADQLAKGAEVYNAACTICHTAGIAGAPRMGAAEDWNDRVAQGRDTLYEHAIKGYVGSKGVMPPKGGRADLSDDDVKAAVEYMLSQLTVTAT